jgi:hypothetical protein
MTQETIDIFDRFAIAALQGILSNRDAYPKHTTDSVMAKDIYDIALAMMLERYTRHDKFENTKQEVKCG